MQSAKGVAGVPYLSSVKAVRYSLLQIIIQSPVGVERAGV
jgi:hypothetical protein